MARIAYLILCHKDPEGIARLASTLTAAGDALAIHFDANASEAHWKKLRALLDGNPNIAFVEKRIRCGWGEYSLVDASKRAVQLAFNRFPDATHFYLISGDCRPIKSAEYMHEWLEANDRDYIESFDFFTSDWIKTGIKEDRLIYRHFLNERKYKQLFYASLNFQRRFNLRREIPEDLEIQIGSQWWCLRRETIRRILEFCKERRDVLRFFKTTWIPDETFFQTLVRHLVPRTEIVSESPTFKMFTDYGMPLVFYNDHYNLMVNQEKLFARKISPEATLLTEQLYELYAQKGVSFDVTNDGPKLFNYLTSRGRVGRRYSPRFWEADSSYGRDRELLIVICKKWHVAKRLVESARQHTDIHCLAYLFNELDAGQPSLGGVESTISKRHRHRRLLVRMLFDYYDSRKLVICMDPAQLDVVDDFMADRGDTAILEIDCQFSDAYLEGHARRVGLIGDNSPEATIAQVLPGIQSDLDGEREKLRDRKYARHYRIAEWFDQTENAVAISQFLDIDETQSQKIAETPHLFAD